MEKDRVNRYNDTIVLPVKTRLKVGTIVNLRDLEEEDIDITIKDPMLMTGGVGDAIFDSIDNPDDVFDPQG